MSYTKEKTMVYAFKAMFQNQMDFFHFLSLEKSVILSFYICSFAERKSVTVFFVYW